MSKRIACRRWPSPSAKLCCRPWVNRLWSHCFLPNRKWRKQAFACDCLIFGHYWDWSTDEIDGALAVCQQLRSMSKTLPIIFFTAEITTMKHHLCCAWAQIDYLTKRYQFLPHLLARYCCLYSGVRVTQSTASPHRLSAMWELSMDSKPHDGKLAKANYWIDCGPNFGCCIAYC